MPHGEVEGLIVEAELPYPQAAEPGPGFGTIGFNDSSRRVAGNCGHVRVQPLRHSRVDIGGLSKYVRNLNRLGIRQSQILVKLGTYSAVRWTFGDEGARATMIAFGQSVYNCQSLHFCLWLWLHRLQSIPLARLNHFRQ